MAGHLPPLTARNACHAVFHLWDCPKGQRGERELGASQWSQAGDLRGLWGEATGHPHTRLEVRVPNLIRAASQRLSPAMCTRELPGKVRIVYGSAIKHPLCVKTWVWHIRNRRGEQGKNQRRKMRRAEGSLQQQKQEGHACPSLSNRQREHERKIIACLVGTSFYHHCVKNL